MARRTTTRFNRQRPKRELIWTTTVFQARNAGVTTAEIPTNLVTEVDWGRAQVGFEKGAVLKAIRGWYQVAYGPSSTSLAPSWYMSVFKTTIDEDFTLSNWTVAAAYNSEDVLYTDGGHHALAAATPAAATPWPSGGYATMARQMEVKANRKLTSNECIKLAFVTPSAAQDWTMSGVFRALIALP